MTGRERVKAAVTFTGPDRPPWDLWALPYICLFRQVELADVLARFPGDIVRPETSPGSGDADLRKLARRGTYTDEWGSAWEVGEPGIIGEVKHPPLAEWSALDTYQPPWDQIRRRDVSHVNRLCESSDRFMLSPVCARPFERLQFVRGTENTFLDLAYGTSEVFRLLEMIHEFYLEDVRSWAASEVDAVFLGEAEESVIEAMRFPKEPPAGVLYRDVASEGTARFVGDLSRLPIPSWHLAPPESYRGLPNGVVIRRMPYAPIITTRGCPYRCTFCAGFRIDRKSVV